MSRQYSGVLGMLAFGVSIARGIVGGSSLNSVMLLAVGSMFLFGFVGWIVGNIADATVADSVRWQLNKELADYEEQLSEDSAAVLKT